MNLIDTPKSSDQHEINDIYPIHYHGYIEFYNTNKIDETNISNELFKFYQSHSELLGIG